MIHRFYMPACTSAYRHAVAGRRKRVVWMVLLIVKDFPPLIPPEQTGVTVSSRQLQWAAHQRVEGQVGLLPLGVMGEHGTSDQKQTLC